MPIPREPTSARRRGRRRSIPVAWGAAAVLLLTALALRLAARPGGPQPDPISIPSPYHAAAADPAQPSPTSTPAATATAVSTTAVPTVGTGWVSVAAATPTPPPQAPPLPTPAPVSRRPTPTPGIASCVSYTASGTTSLAAWGQVLVEIEAYNGCARDLEPLEVWFEVQGWREGGLVQTARGHLFSELRRGRYERTTIALPGSASWYDRIVVLPLEPQNGP